MRKQLSFFLVPALVLAGIIVYGVLYHIQNMQLADYTILLVIIVGSLKLIKDTVTNILHGNFALDYIAILAISVGVVSHQYIAAAVIVLMMAGGNALEQYGLAKAKRSLTALVDRIPDNVQVIQEDGTMLTLPRVNVQKGMHVLIRKGEVIALDGILLSKEALVDEASLTGEPYPCNKNQGAMVTSGTVNVGESFSMEVVRLDAESTYSRIVAMVQEAQDNKSPIIRLADKYSIIFTVITLLIAALAYYIHHDMQYVLAVLVIATPCPLILATPVALMGGMSSSAKRLIIVKHLAALEALVRVQVVVIDKTGTITLGTPSVTRVDILQAGSDTKQLFAIAASLETHSLHPLARAIVAYAQTKNAIPIAVHNVSEQVGEGIVGEYEGHTYRLGKDASSTGMCIGMRRDKQQVLRFVCEDTIKPDTSQSLGKLLQQGYEISMYTGDHQQAAQSIVDTLQLPIHVVADCTPEDKQQSIVNYHKQGKVVAMVGDGINDAPALAQADVGMVFSHNEHTATTEGADIVFLSGQMTNVVEAFRIAQASVRIAKQSIFFGMALSTTGMILACLGYIPPIVGAGIQELIDVIAIINALRSSKL